MLIALQDVRQSFWVLFYPFATAPTLYLSRRRKEEKGTKRKKEKRKENKEKKDTQSYHLIVGAGVKFKSKPNVKILQSLFIIITNIR